MTGWAAKRFWKMAHVVACDGGYTVHLDARPLRTPAKAALIVPTEALAQRIAQEWDAQEGALRPLSMPFTRSANAALDKVVPQQAEVAAMIADYGGTDLLCYRAPSPQELITRQAAGWDPLLDWAAKAFGARLSVGQGVMHVAQPPVALAALSQAVARLDPFALTALHDLVGLSGSLILGLAVTEGRLAAPEAWALSRIDEEWQAELWGRDDEAEALAAHKKSEFLHARQFFELSRRPDTVV